MLPILAGGFIILATCMGYNHHAIDYGTAFSICIGTVVLVGISYLPSIFKKDIGKRY